jgi:hypothetical protein
LWWSGVVPDHILHFLVLGVGYGQVVKTGHCGGYISGSQEVFDFGHFEHIKDVELSGG